MINDSSEICKHGIIAASFQLLILKMLVSLLYYTFFYAQPGQNFNFVAKNVKGQQLKGYAKMGSSLNLGNAAFDLNSVSADVARKAALEE